jgi:CheY-like chemotaxis protein
MPLYTEQFEGKQKEEAIAPDAGIQFLRSFGIAKCPIVVFTAYPSYEDCVRAVNAGATAYLPKQEQEVYNGRWEGGIDRLIDKCRTLLDKTRAVETRLPPDGPWLDRNYEWLREKFGGQWVAFVRAELARTAGITGAEREGLVVVSENSKEMLAQIIAQKHPTLKEIPVITLVPESEHQSD